MVCHYLCSLGKNVHDAHKDCDMIVFDLNAACEDGHVWLGGQLIGQ